MDIAASLRFTTEDKKWVEKILIAAVLIFTVIGGIAVLGWTVEIVRRVIRQDQELLPEWGEIGKYFVDGLIVIGVIFLWMLPLIVVAACLGIFGAIVSSAASDSGGNAGTWLGACIAFLSLPYGLIVSFLIPPMMGIYATQGRFADAVNPAKAWQLARANLGGFLVAWVVAAAVGLVASVVGSILCLIGTYPLTAYAAAVSGHLYGQAYREGMAGLPAA